VLIDLHVHLDLYPDPRHVVAEVVRREMHALCMTTTPSAWAGTSALVENCKRIRVGLGLHPQLAQERLFELPLVDEYIKKTRYVGEIGLDGSPAHKKSMESQRRAFGYMLSCSTSAGGRFLSIHSRGATTAVLDMLASYPDAGIPILHWFSGNAAELRRAIEMGCWFSVGPGMTRTQKGSAHFMSMPEDRIITETDGPFFRINDQPAMPWNVEDALRDMSNMRDMDYLEITSIIYNNFNRLVRLLS